MIEVTENICKRLLDYNLHKERSGSNRFAKVRGGLFLRFLLPIPTHPFAARVTVQIHSSHPLDPLLVPGM